MKLAYKIYSLLLCFCVFNLQAVLIKNTTYDNITVDFTIGTASSQAMILAHKIVEKPLPEGNYNISVLKQLSSESPDEFERHLKPDDIIIISSASTALYKYDLVVQSKEMREKAEEKKLSEPVQTLIDNLKSKQEALQQVKSMGEITSFERALEARAYVATILVNIIELKKTIETTLPQYLPKKLESKKYEEPSQDYKALKESFIFSSSLIKQCRELNEQLENKIIYLLEQHVKDFNDVLTSISGHKVDEYITGVVNTNITNINDYLTFLKTFLIYVGSNYETVKKEWLEEIKEYDKSPLFKKYSSAQEVLDNIYPILSEITQIKISKNSPFSLISKVSFRIEQFVKAGMINKKNVDFVEYIAEFLQPTTWPVYNSYLRGKEVIASLTFSTPHVAHIKQINVDLRTIKKKFLNIISASGPEQLISEQEIIKALGVSRLPDMPEHILHVRKNASREEISDAFLDLKNFWQDFENKPLAAQVVSRINEAYGKLEPQASLQRVKKYLKDPSTVFKIHFDIYSQDYKRMKTMRDADPTLFKAILDEDPILPLRAHIDTIINNIRQVLTSNDENSIEYWIEQRPFDEYLMNTELQYKSLLREFEKLKS